MNNRRIFVLGPLMGGHGSRAFLGQELSSGGRLRPIVLVFLPEELIEDKETFGRIRRDTELAVHLDHRNVITILGLIELEDGIARAVEFADAESLRSLFTQTRQARREIPHGVAAAIIADACAGVHYAHEMGLREMGRPLLHMAIRPETLLVTFKGIGMVTGYGASAMVEGRLRISGTASMRDPYTAPEQVFGGRKAATEQTDVYGLGSVLFEALSGHPPVESTHTMAIANIDPSRGRLAGVPEDLAETAMKAIAKESKNRFQTAAELREALLEQGELATNREVATFMESIFPPETPQLQARRALLKQGHLEYDTEPRSFTEQSVKATLVWRYPDREVKATKLPVEKPIPRRFSLKDLLVVGLTAVVAFVLGMVLLDQRGRKKDEPDTLPNRAVGSTTEHGSRSAGAPPPTNMPTKPPSTPIAQPKATVPSLPKPQAPARKKPVPRAPKRKLAARSPKTGPDLTAPHKTTGTTENTGTLHIEAPPGSKVYIRDDFKGVAPLRGLKLPPGEHRVVVVKEGGGPSYEHLVPVRAGDELTLTVDFYRELRSPAPPTHTRD